MLTLMPANSRNQDRIVTVREKKRPKVLHLITWLSPGGIEKWLLTMLSQVDRSQYAMDFCCKGASPGKLAHVARDMGAEVVHCPLTAPHVGFGRKFKSIVKRGEYDIVHNHLETYSGYPVWLSRQVGVPVITSFHNTSFAPQTWTQLPGLRTLRSIYSRLSIDYALNNSNFLTGCSRSVASSLGARHRAQNEFRILHYGVESLPTPQESERQAFRVNMGWAADSPVVVHVGRFFEQKNHVGVVETFARVKSRVPSAKLLLIGDGPLRPRIVLEIKRLGLETAVTLLGVRTDARELVAMCDVFLFPSLHEGFGLAALEANAAGLPVVGTNIPGLNEAVVDGKTSLLHEIEDAQGLAGSVIDLLKNRDYARRLGEAGRERAREDFSVAASASRLTDLYDECCRIG